MEKDEYVQVILGRLIAPVSFPVPLSVYKGSYLCTFS